MHLPGERDEACTRRVFVENLRLGERACALQAAVVAGSAVDLPVPRALVVERGDEVERRVEVALCLEADQEGATGECVLVMRGVDEEVILEGEGLAPPREAEPSEVDAGERACRLRPEE